MRYKNSKNCTDLYSITEIVKFLCFNRLQSFNCRKAKKMGNAGFPKKFSSFDLIFIYKFFLSPLLLVN